ncbi:MAG: hypothetical protein WCO82_07200 [Sphingomonadales bacterium]
MIRRLPLLLTLLPLLAGLALYWVLWRDWADDFARRLQPWFPGQAIVVTGFPYRMEVELGPVQLANAGPVLLDVTAPRLRMNRGPWRPELTVAQLQQPRLALGLGAPLRLEVAAPALLASVHVDGGRLERLSVSGDNVTLRPGFAPGFAVQHLEVHVRERQLAATANSPTPPVQGQLRAEAQGLQLPGLPPLQLALEAGVTGPARLTDFARWAGSGTIEINRLALSDGLGELLSAKLTLVPQGRDAMRLAGTITTICPALVARLLGSAPVAAEPRLRMPVRLAVEGQIGAGQWFRLTGQTADLATRPRRAQMAACPG